MLVRSLALFLATCGASASFAQPTTMPASGPATRDPPLPLASLDALRIDRRMTLFASGETIEPFGRDLDASATFVVELPSHRELLADLARRRGTTRPAVRLLPEDSRTADRFGLVTAAHAILRKSPADVPGDRENLSDVTRYEPVWILDANYAGDALLVHASDGYLGWVSAGAVRVVGEPQFLHRLKDGRDDASAARVVAVIESARARVGTRYVWGGKTADGIDCSGLVQTSFARVGVALPRDADQQSLVGRLVATRWCAGALLPGDLLFYVSPRRGNVHHVAIYLGDGEYVEAAGPDVHVSSMTPGAPNYDARRAATFGWARRVIE